ncbi:flagellar hook-associated protein 3 [Halomonas ventosae]|uniref:Flagellar hook-associated protein 3 n=1 Tax=Halomonas ventosae TaxID=229007 RepID=A0A4R6ZUF3_9GAMM|nr:flagellar hook-associated protein 3 [Halomonas ventosae]
MMRVSSVAMFEQNVANLNRQQSEFLKVGDQFATGRRVVRPSDDPQAASRAVGVSQSMAVNEQFSDARISVRNSLGQTEGALESMTNAVVRARTLAVQAASDTLSPADRASLTSELKGILETMLGQANATDGNGSYLFGGYRDDSPPFTRDATGAIAYQGDELVREQRVDSSRHMQVGESGEALFGQMFDTMQGFVTAMEAPRDTPAERDAARGAIDATLRDLDTSLDTLLTRRASVGARLNELDSLDTIGGNRTLNYERTLSDLIDLDYVEAAAEYSLRQVGLQAAQRSFVDVQKMSLFNYM